MPGHPSVRNVLVLATILLTLVAASSTGRVVHTSPSEAPPASMTPHASLVPESTSPAEDFTTISKLVNDAIAARGCRAPW